MAERPRLKAGRDWWKKITLREIQIAFAFVAGFVVAVILLAPSSSCAATVWATAGIQNSCHPTSVVSVNSWSNSEIKFTVPQNQEIAQAPLQYAATIASHIPISWVVGMVLDLLPVETAYSPSSPGGVAENVSVVTDVGESNLVVFTDTGKTSLSSNDFVRGAQELWTNLSNYAIGQVESLITLPAIGLANDLGTGARAISAAMLSKQNSESLSPSKASDQVSTAAPTSKTRATQKIIPMPQSNTVSPPPPTSASTPRLPSSIPSGAANLDTQQMVRILADTVAIYASNSAGKAPLGDTPPTNQIATLKRGDTVKFTSEDFLFANPLDTATKSTMAIGVELPSGEKGWIVGYGVDPTTLAEVISPGMNGN